MINSELCSRIAVFKSLLQLDLATLRAKLQCRHAVNLRVQVIFPVELCLRDCLEATCRQSISGLPMQVCFALTGPNCPSKSIDSSTSYYETKLQVLNSLSQQYGHTIFCTGPAQRLPRDFDKHTLCSESVLATAKTGQWTCIPDVAAITFQPQAVVPQKCKQAVAHQKCKKTNLSRTIIAPASVSVFNTTTSCCPPIKMTGCVMWQLEAGSNSGGRLKFQP